MLGNRTGANDTRCFRVTVKGASVLKRPFTRRVRSGKTRQTLPMIAQIDGPMVPIPRSRPSMASLLTRVPGGTLRPAVGLPKPCAPRPGARPGRVCAWQPANRADGILRRNDNNRTLSRCKGCTTRLPHRLRRSIRLNIQDVCGYRNHENGEYELNSWLRGLFSKSLRYTASASGTDLRKDLIACSKPWHCMWRLRSSG